jgi:hypothetical protein
MEGAFVPLQTGAGTATAWGPPADLRCRGDPRFLQRVAGAAQDNVLELPDLKKPRLPADGRKKTIIWVADGESNPDQALASEPLSGPCGSWRRSPLDNRNSALRFWNVSFQGSDHSPANEHSIFLEPRIATAAKLALA